MAKTINDYRIVNPIKIVVTKESKNLNQFNLTIEGLDAASSCVLGDALARKPGFVAELARYFAREGEVTAIVFAASQSQNGATTVETASKKNETVSREVESYPAHFPRQSAGVGRTAYSSYRVAPVTYVNTGRCYCPY